MKMRSHCLRQYGLVFALVLSCLLPKLAQAFTLIGGRTAGVAVVTPTILASIPTGPGGFDTRLAATAGCAAANALFFDNPFRSLTMRRGGGGSSSSESVLSVIADSAVPPGR